MFGDFVLIDDALWALHVVVGWQDCQKCGKIYDKGQSIHLEELPIKHSRNR